MEKAKCRIEMKKCLKALNENDLLVLSRNLSNNLVKFLPRIVSHFTEGSQLNIGVYSPIEQEPRWFEMVTTNWSGVSFSVVHIEDSKALGFYEMNLEEIKAGVGLKLDGRYLSKPRTPDVVLVPGLCFTKSMERLGRGGGYYDRYLENFSGLVIGVCFDFQVKGKIETNEFDQKMNFIITDENIYNERK